MTSKIKSKDYQNHEHILKQFLFIETEARKFINQWRIKNGGVLTKINAHGVKDIVTEVDRSIEEFVIQTLGPNTFGEESFQNNFDILEEPFFYIIDPIDGTRQLVYGTDEWSISLCAVQNGQPVVSMISMPDKNLVFTSVQRKGVFINKKRISEPSQSTQKLAVGPGQGKSEIVQSRATGIGYNTIKISALTPKICSILTGEVDAAVYFPQKGTSATLWDYAAAYMLIHEFGGIITSLDGSPLPFQGEKVIHKKGWLAAKNINIYHKLFPQLFTIKL